MCICIYFNPQFNSPLPFQFPYEDMLMAHHLEKRWKRLFLSALYRYEKLQPIKQKFADMTSVEIDEFCDDVSCRRGEKEVPGGPSFSSCGNGIRAEADAEAEAALSTLHFRYFAFIFCNSVLFPPIIISFQWHFNWIFPRAQPLLSIVSGDVAAVVSVKWINLKCLSFELERKTDGCGGWVGQRPPIPSVTATLCCTNLFSFAWQLAEFIKDYDENGPGSVGAELERGVRLMDPYGQKIAERESRREELANAERLFDMAMVDYHEFARVQTEFEGLQQVGYSE